MFSYTYAWGGTSWKDTAFYAGPEPEYLPAVVYEDARKQVLLFGGAKDKGSATALDQTWVYYSHGGAYTWC